MIISTMEPKVAFITAPIATDVWADILKIKSYDDSFLVKQRGRKKTWSANFSIWLDSNGDSWIWFSVGKDKVFIFKGKLKIS